MKKKVRPRNPVAYALALRGRGKVMRDRRLRRIKDRERRERKAAREDPRG